MDIYKDSPRESIYYISAVLDCSNYSRSEIAEDATRAISKIIERPIIIMFKHKESILFSNCIPDNTGKRFVYMTSWYATSEPDITDMIEIQDINAGNMIRHSAYDFLHDFVYCAARKYYAFPEFHHYQKYEITARKYSYDEIALGISPPSYKVDEEIPSFKELYGYDYVNNEGETDNNVKEREEEEQLIKELIEESYLLELEDEDADEEHDQVELEEVYEADYDEEIDYNDPLDILKAINQRK